MAALPVLAVIASVGSAVVGTYAAIRSGQQTAAADKYNEEVAQQNAQIAKQQGEAAAEQQQRETQRKIGAMVANYGASGVDASTGTPLDVLTDSVQQGTLDQLTAKYNYSLRAAGAQDDAGLDQSAASNATASGYLNAAGTALGGAGNAMRTYDKYYGGNDI